MKILSCMVRGVLAGMMIAIGGYAFLGCENRVVGALLFTVGLITITLFGFDLYTGRVGYWLTQTSAERWQTLFSLPCNAVAACWQECSRRPAGEVLALCEARLAKSPTTLLTDGFFCGVLIYICVEIYKTRGTVKGILICIPTFILCGFEHSVADLFYFANARIFSGQAMGAVLLVALGNAAGALLIPAAQLVSGQSRNWKLNDQRTPPASQGTVMNGGLFVLCSGSGQKEADKTETCPEPAG